MQAKRIKSEIGIECDVLLYTHNNANAMTHAANELDCPPAAPAVDVLVPAVVDTAETLFRAVFVADSFCELTVLVCKELVFVEDFCSVEVAADASIVLSATVSVPSTTSPEDAKLNTWPCTISAGLPCDKVVPSTMTRFDARGSWTTVYCAPLTSTTCVSTFAVETGLGIGIVVLLSNTMPEEPRLNVWPLFTVGEPPIVREAPLTTTTGVGPKSAVATNVLPPTTNVVEAAAAAPIGVLDDCDKPPGTETVVEDPLTTTARPPEAALTTCVPIVAAGPLI